MKSLKLLITLSLASLAAYPAMAHETMTHEIMADQAKSTSPHQHQQTMNMFGGATYHGEPALAVTVALIEAGGGAENFSFAKALVHMLGQETVNQEVAKLTKQYSKEEVNTFLVGMDAAVNYAIKHVTKMGIELPEAADLNGQELAATLVKAGTTPDGTFWSGYLFDKALSNKIHNLVMIDINANEGYQADKISHKILNQAMYDVAQALGMKEVKLAELH